MPLPSGARAENAVLFKNILAYFYPMDPPPDITPHMVNITVEMLSKLMRVTGRDNEDPRPDVLRPGHIYSVQKRAEMTWAEIQKNKTLYETHSRRIAADFAGRYVLAKNGCTN